jgi:putative transposase
MNYRNNRRSIRLPEYDYSQPGAYFVTLVTRERECLFGEIKNDVIFLSEAGRIVWEVWNSLPAR